MAASARFSCGRTLMKYDDVQQPTQSPQATSMPGPPASARRMSRSQSEKLPAGITSLMDSYARVEPLQRLGFVREHVAVHAAVVRHEHREFLRVHDLVRHDQRDPQRPRGLRPTHRDFVAHERRDVLEAPDAVDVDEHVAAARLARPAHGAHAEAERVMEAGREYGTIERALA